jgi:hypothetical protein
MHTGCASYYARAAYLEGDNTLTRQVGSAVVQTTIRYFYVLWRTKQLTPNGKADPDYWRKSCLWFEVVADSIPWACALDDWEAVRKIAEYPLDEAFPEARKAKGETAWLRALICYLRDEPRANVEAYLAKAENDKAKRPKLLVPVLRALLDKDESAYRRALLAYLEYYRKSEFKLILDKVLALDGTTLYHLGRRLGFTVELPANVADHVIRL